MKFNMRFGIGSLALISLLTAIYIIFMGVTLGGKLALAYETAYHESYTYIYENSYQLGHEEQLPVGRDEGYTQGFEKGSQQGFDAGYESGLEDGKKEGYEQGYESGLEDGHISGLNVGQKEGYESGYNKGMNIGLDDGELARIDLHNPTYEEALLFLQRDQTNYKSYDINGWNCTDYSATVVNNAEAEGIRAAFVLIEYYGNIANHTIVAFETEDQGLVYFEPQKDDRANVKVGRRFYQCIVPKPGYYYPYPGFDDTIMDIQIIW